MDDYSALFILSYFFSAPLISPQPVMSQPYPVPIPLPQPKSRPLTDSRGIPDTLSLRLRGKLFQGSLTKKNMDLCPVSSFFYLVTGLANGMQKVKVFNAGGRISCGTLF